MKKLMKTFMLSSALALCLSGAMAQFGSKVGSGDTDVDRFLEDFTAPLNPDLGYWDIGPNPGIYDQGDIIYLDMVNNDVTNANDIRLTAFGSCPAGTKITAADNDINKPLLSLPGAAAGIYYTDLYGSSGYDFQDPVYILSRTNDFFGARTMTNDVRLNQINGLAAGTKVVDYNPDHDKNAVPMVVPVSLGGPIATLRFYNGNGNVNEVGVPIYDCGDDVYIDISLPGSAVGGHPFGFVSPNDIRLSGPIITPKPRTSPGYRYGDP